MCGGEGCCSCINIAGRVGVEVCRCEYVGVCLCV